jgi:uncharacterized protein YbjT (DUF2867 family)
MMVLLTGVTGYIGSAIATALQTTHHTRSDAQQMMGALADALVLDRQFSAATARQVLAWQPQAPSLFDELKEGTYAIG